MSRALIIKNQKLYELFGNQYIPFNDLDNNLDEYKVTKDEVISISLDSEITTQVYIYKSPTMYNCYQQQLTISGRSSEIVIDQMSSGEAISFDLDNNMIVNESKIQIFKNHQLCTSPYITYEAYDVIHIGVYLCIIINGQFEFEITIYDKQKTKSALASLAELNSQYKDFPIYTNTPKLKYTIEEITVDLRGPQEAEKKNDVKAVVKRLVPVIITFTLTLILMYFKPRGPYVIISLSTTIVTVIITIVTFIGDRKENKLFNIERSRIYEDYLHDTIRDLTALKKEEEGILNYLFPTTDKLIEEVDNNTTRLYERDESDDDFLKINIGITNSEPTYKLSNPIDELKIYKEDLELRVDAIYNKFKQLQNVPKVANLYSNNIGIVGGKTAIHTQLQSILMQLAFFHTYHDIKIIPVIEPVERRHFDKFNFTKHFQFEDGMYTMIDDELTRDAILSAVVQVLRARQNADEETSKLPIFIFIITNFDLIANHPIMEFINDELHDLGLKVIFASERQENLISNLQTIVHLKNSQQAQVIIENSVIKDEKFLLQRINSESKLTESVKKIGQLDHIKGVKSSLPEAISFLEMYNVERVSDLDISSRWQQNKTDKSIKALVGKKSQVDDVYLDLHEKVHGPHGLVAGTTGSGKSEVIQTYILSLGINYSPEYVGFLLIDYKGGGMANLFKNMPHLLGSITNLDGYLAMRAMESIKGELKRRQSLFSKHEVNHINGYHKLYKQGIVTEPLPHLFLISDEFAELKSNEPEFMKELVSAARIGRSLGIHLILATQKPSGVVDDQIWSNSKFKLCLKVAEPADSRELLKTTDAAYIVEPGRGYLKVGTNELYELFQSGYSGAPYNKGDNSQKDERLFIIDKFGRENLVNKKVKDTSVDSKDELTVVLEEVSKTYDSANYTPVTKPWLPPLEDNVALKLSYKPLDDTKLDLVASIGLIDIPSTQSQIALKTDLLEEGNIGVFGAMQMGKTTTIQSILMSLAANNSPKNLSYYVLDFGNGKLVSLKGLKHTADYITIEEGDKLQKLFKHLKQEVKTRKEKLSEAMASNFGGYNQVADTPMQAIVVTLDNYDVLRDMVDLAAEFNFIYREGASLGIYTITSAMRMGSLRLPHQAAINRAIQHFTTDKTDITNALGARSNYELKEMQGRVQVKVEDPEVAQVYTPVKAETEKDYINNLKEAVESINTNTNYINHPLPTMPEVVEYKQEYKQDNKIFLGLDYENIEPQYLGYRDFAIVGAGNSVRSNLLKNLLKQIENSIKFVIDDSGMQLYEIFYKRADVYYTKNDIEKLNVKLETEIENRQSNYDKYVEENGFIVPKFYYDKQEQVIIVIRDLRGLTELDMANKNKLLESLKKTRDVGIKMIIDAEDGKGIDEMTKFAKTFSDFLLLCATNEQQLKLISKAQVCGANNLIHVEDGAIQVIRKEGE